MPGQFRQYVPCNGLHEGRNGLMDGARIQDAYAGEFHTFKPDKKLYWLPHLGTISLEIELQDRTVNAEVPPLEAAVIEHFSAKGAGSFFVRSLEIAKVMVLVDTWDVTALAAEIKLDKAVVLKALMTWVDLGVLKEEDVTRYKLLEVAEDGPAGAKPVPRQGTQIICRGTTGCLTRWAVVIEDVSPILTVQQEQAEQMKVYWKVRNTAVSVRVVQDG